MKKNRKTFRLIAINILILFTVNSCQKVKNDSDIKDVLFYELIKYQKENRIDKKNAEFFGEKHFIYEVTILPTNYSNPDDKNISVYLLCI